VEGGREACWGGGEGGRRSVRGGGVEGGSEGGLFGGGTLFLSLVAALLAAALWGLVLSHTVTRPRAQLGCQHMPLLATGVRKHRLAPRIWQSGAG
jgi:hypothetical protein